MSWTCAQLAEWCGGELRGDGARTLAGVSTDSRSLAPGELFVAIAGEHFDGHGFVEQAVERGAAALLVSRNGFAPPGVPVIRVGDSVAALGALARAHRRAFAGPVLAITGSNGKTTTREMCASVLTAAGVPTHRSRGNLNNQIGLPLSILALAPEHRAAVFELGMNHPGEIALLAEIASPDVGAITQISAAHLGPMGSLEAIARAKGELLELIRPGGTAVLNADDPRALEQAPRFAGRKLWFGRSARADVRAHDVVAERTGTRFRLVAPSLEQSVRLPLPGLHLVDNALCAAAAALASGLLEERGAEALARGLADFRGVPGRLAPRELARGALLLDDSYNANPASLRAALETLVALRGSGRAIAVVGDMLELGDDAARLHAEAGREAAELGVDVLVAVGTLAREAAQSARRAGVGLVREAPDAAAAAREVCELLREGDTLLVKGSRAMRMEQIVSALTEVKD